MEKELEAFFERLPDVGEIQGHIVPPYESAKIEFEGGDKKVLFVGGRIGAGLVVSSETHKSADFKFRKEVLKDPYNLYKSDIKSYIPLVEKRGD